MTLEDLSPDAIQALLLRHPWTAGFRISQELWDAGIIHCKKGRGWVFTPEGKELALQAARQVVWDGSIGSEIGMMSAQEVQAKMLERERIRQHESFLRSQHDDSGEGGTAQRDYRKGGDTQ